tara:strand:+ start:3626 stop:4771 length:1146 start_codon:yes stop_codon:yes gene_type:complete
MLKRHVQHKELCEVYEKHLGRSCDRESYELYQKNNISIKSIEGGILKSEEYASRKKFKEQPNEIIPILDCDVLIVSHTSDGGAKTYVMELCKTLNKKSIKTHLCLPFKFDSHYSFNNNKQILKDIILRGNIKQIIFSSWHFAFDYVLESKIVLDKSIFLCQEYIKDYANTFDIRTIVCVGNQIAKDLHDKHIVLSCPWKTDWNFGSHRRNNSKKVVIGMVGNIDDKRKNFAYFKHISSILTNINFVWIGGPSTVIKNNLCIKKFTDDVYSELYELDYLFLSSTHDPCPYVVLESIVCGVIPIIFNNVGHKYDSLYHGTKRLIYQFKNPLQDDYVIPFLDGLSKPTLSSDEMCTMKQYVNDNFSNISREFYDLITQRCGIGQ